MKVRGNLLWPASVFGTLVGRFAGRISRAKFLLDGREYTLARGDIILPPRRPIRSYDSLRVFV